MRVLKENVTNSALDSRRKERDLKELGTADLPT
jgi:hypothetical protein